MFASPNRRANDTLDGLGMNGLLQRPNDQRLVAAFPAFDLKRSINAPPREMFTRCLLSSTAPLVPRFQDLGTMRAYASRGANQCPFSSAC